MGALRGPCGLKFEIGLLQRAVSIASPVGCGFRPVAILFCFQLVLEGSSVFLTVF